MYCEPYFFRPEEIFPPSVVKSHMSSYNMIKNNIWRLIDSKVIETLDLLRKRFGPVIVNDYLFGGNNKYRGYRPSIEIIQNNVGTFTSQHCFGRAIDCVFKSISVDEVREDIYEQPNLACYKYISAVENNVSWLHFDVRAWDKSKGILFFSK